MTGRHRPRVSVIKDREEHTDEQNLWNELCDKIKKAAALNKKSEENEKAITVEEDAMRDSDVSLNVSRLEALEQLYREGVKLAEEELKILNDEPDDLIRNLEMLASIRAAFEADTPRVTTAMKPRGLKRRFDADGSADSPAQTPEVSTPAPASRVMSKAASRSGSVAASSIKAEAASESGDAMDVNSDKLMRFTVGTEVFYRNKAKGAEGEGILCSVTNIIGDGKQRRYEIQDIEPELDEDGREPSPYRASVQSLIAIPSATAPLPDLPRGKQVLALYPQTTTFYKAELVAMRKDHCRLRFEGEDEKDKEQDVERRYVLDVAGVAK